MAPTGAQALRSNWSRSMCAPMNGCTRCNSSILRMNARSASLTGRGKQYTEPLLMPSNSACRTVQVVFTVDHRFALSGPVSVSAPFK